MAHKQYFSIRLYHGFNSFCWKISYCRFAHLFAYLPAFFQLVSSAYRETTDHFLKTDARYIRKHPGLYESSFQSRMLHRRDYQHFGSWNSLELTAAGLNSLQISKCTEANVTIISELRWFFTTLAQWEQFQKKKFNVRLCGMSINVFSSLWHVYWCV